MEKPGFERPEMADGQTDLDALVGAPTHEEARSMRQSPRHGSERVFVDDLSYEPMCCIDTLLVTFADS